MFLMAALRRLMHHHLPVLSLQLLHSSLEFKIKSCEFGQCLALCHDFVLTVSGSSDTYVRTNVV